MSVDISSFLDANETPALFIADSEADRYDRLYTGSRTDLREVEPDRLSFPVEKAVSFETDSISLPSKDVVFRYQGTGRVIPNVSLEDGRRLPERPYLIEPTSRNTKIFIEVEARIEVLENRRSFTLDFGEATTVRVGARSLLSKPWKKVTVTDAIDDVFALLSRLGPPGTGVEYQHSYPSRRSHPPRVELASTATENSLQEAGDSTVELFVPGNRRQLYPLAPLAYYLGASVYEDSTPRLVADGFEYEFPQGDGYQADVNEVLRQVFFLDCLVSNSQLEPVRLEERRRVVEELDVGIDRLAGQPRPDQLEAYLSVERDALSEFLPRCHLTVGVEPTVEAVEALPFLAYDLAHVRIADDSTAVRPTVDGAIGRGWVGSGVVANAEQIDPEARGDVRRKAVSTDSRRTFTFACDSSIDVEAGRECFTPLNWYEVDLSPPFRSSESDLRDVFCETNEFLACVGEFDARGFQCTDGILALGSLPHVRTDVVVLAGENSRAHGRRLVRDGARAVVAVGGRGGRDLLQYSRVVGLLLVAGFPVRTAATFARDWVSPELSFVVYGDGWTTVASSETSVRPVRWDVTMPSDRRFEVELTAYTRMGYEVGSTFSPEFEPDGAYYLVPKAIGPYVVSENELKDALMNGRVAVTLGDEIYLSPGFLQLLDSGG